MIVTVRAPDEDAVYAEAESWNDPDRGLLVVLAPPIVTRPSELLGRAVAALDGTPLWRPGSGEAQALENGVVRLRAHRVDALVLLHSWWIPAAVHSALAAALGALDLDLLVVTHPAAGAAAVDAWSADSWSWGELRAWVAARRPAGDARAADPVRHLAAGTVPFAVRRPEDGARSGP